MGAITPTMQVTLETGIIQGVANGYDSLVDNMWWERWSKFRTTTFQKDLINWWINLFQLRQEGKEGGRKTFQDLQMLSTEYEHEHAGGGIVINNDQLNDTDGNGWKIAGQWSYEAGQYMRYWPQKRVTHFLKNAHALASAGGYTAHDGLAFFSKVHPNNGKDTSRGTYANLFSGAAVAASAGTPYYPGACPLDTTNAPLDATAVANLSKLWAYVASIFQANGEDPKRLSVRRIGCGPQLFPRVCQLLDAKFIQAAAGGTTDITGLISALKYTTPELMHELSGFESDTTFFLEIDDNDPLSGAIYTEREPFGVKMYGPQTQAELNRRNEWDYEVDGRNKVGAGKPYGLAKCTGT